MRARPPALIVAGLALAAGLAGCGGGASNSPKADSPTTTRASARATLVPPVSSGTTPTVGTTPSSGLAAPLCVRGAMAVSASVTSQPAPVCLVTGSTLSVTFDKSRAAVGLPGPWGVPLVEVQPRSILRVRSTSTKGTLLIAHLVALRPGTGSVLAGFNQECSAGDTTPCTIPPQAILSVSVTVAPPQR